ncbi:MAG: hypothetical protein IT178_08300 [Acidobacteria bacterium]|nr:hypothetical protein [Acidobacteriota bacterium]
MRRLVFVIVACLAASFDAAAQGIDRPPRATGGIFAQRRAPDPSRPTRELSAMFDFFGGYDDNVTDGVPVGGEVLPQSTYVGRAEGELRYRRARGPRLFEIFGRSYFNHATVNDNQFVGGEVAAQAAAPIGRRFDVTANGSLGYEPTFLFNAFGSLSGQMEGAPVPDSSPTLGITDQRWLVTTGSVMLARDWNARQRMEISYTGGLRRPARGPGLESLTQAAALRHEWRFRRNSGVQLGYAYTDTRQENEDGPAAPVKAHNFDIGLRLAKPVTAHRGTTFLAGGGAAVLQVSPVDGPNFQTTLPTGYGSLRVDMARTWSMTADVRRDVSVLQGITPEPFASTALTVRADGLIAERLQIGASAAYARGGAVDDGAATFETSGTTAQVQFFVARYFSIFTTHRFYRHRLEDILGEVEAFPLRFDRTSIQFGVTIWLPLAGTF